MHAGTRWDPGLFQILQGSIASYCSDLLFNVLEPPPRHFPKGTAAPAASADAYCNVILWVCQVKAGHWRASRENLPPSQNIRHTSGLEPKTGTQVSLVSHPSIATSVMQGKVCWPFLCIPSESHRLSEEILCSAHSSHSFKGQRWGWGGRESKETRTVWGIQTRKPKIKQKRKTGKKNGVHIRARSKGAHFAIYLIKHEWSLFLPEIVLKDTGYYQNMPGPWQRKKEM